MNEIREALKSAIHNLYGLDFDPEVTPSPANIDADYSSNAALKLAKDLHKPPMSIAEEIAGVMPVNARTVVTPPGFLNFISSDEYLYTEIAKNATDFDKNISSHAYAGQTIICEYSDPNPFKVLHVGHLYTSIVGDSISRLYEYAGAKVIRANFGGDVGLHVAKTMYILLQKDTSNLKIEDIATCYIEGTAAYDNDDHARQEITKLNKEIYKINAEDIHGTPLADLYWHGRELSYQYFKDFYASIGMKFDKYYPESTVAALGLATVERELAAGVYEKSDGAVIFDGAKYGLHARVFINKEGVPTYEAKDVGLIFTKWQDYHFDKSIVITGSEQKDYMTVVLKSIEQYAPDLVAKTTHLTHGLVKLPGGVKMSSRKGNFLKAVDVLNLVDEALSTEFGSSDRTISLAATKYAFLKYKMGGNIIFDPAESVKMTGNSGPYLLYSCVRAKKILANVSSGREAIDMTATSTADLHKANIRDNGSGIASEPRNDGRERSGSRVENCRTNSHIEHALMKKLLEYKNILSESVSDLAPHKLAAYLYELAQEFSRFYEACPVAGSEYEAERALLVQVYLKVMTHGLDLLGIKIPEEM
ncbi:arginine--tRNA ligase [Candidatus Saccharibacteria bacterium]|nr:arginine--tRNA ligase [Candidatus Saccharibacteria bacterium]